MSNSNAPLPASQQQKILGSKGLIVLIALLSAFVPLSTDLYLPALPGMSAQFNVSTDQINLTLTMFFVFYSVSTLFWGPLSDRYGRRSVLLVGLSVYVVASVLCALAWNVTSLILFRILQALGGSSAGAVATAIVKDVYAGRKRETVLAIVQSMVLISPALAPVLGALLLQFTSWRGVFISLMGIGLVVVSGVLMMRETIHVRSSGALHSSIGRLGKVLQNRGFRNLLLVCSLGHVASLAFIGSSTYIYQDGFNLSEQAYSFYFSLNALGMITGPMIFLRASRRFKSETIIWACFLTIALSGLLVLLFGNLHPLVFALCILPASTAGSCMRPPAANLMLAQEKEDAGSISSLIASTGLLMGSLGIQIVSMGWGNIIITLSVMMMVTALVSLVAWPFVTRQIKPLPTSVG